MNLQIIYEDESEVAEFDAFNKGYRKDVIVKIDDRVYRLYVISMVRLQQDFEMEVCDSGYYLPEPNTILVNELTRKEIEDTILYLVKNKYFSKIDSKGF